MVATVSPLWLHHADRVALLEGGRVEAVGAHDELLETNAAYRQVVARALDDAPEVDPEVDPRHRERQPAVVPNRPLWAHREHGEDSRA